MRRPRQLLALFLAIAASSALLSSALAQDAADATDANLKTNPEKGWFFYQHPPTVASRKPPAGGKAHAVEPPPSPKCSSMSTWTASCGFIDPGTSFAFQAKERDALLKRMVMSHDDPAAVQAFQYYMKWVTDRAIDAANLWQYNLVQNPSLDPSVRMPFNALGLKLMTDVKDSTAASLYEALRSQKAFLVYFSRYDCEFCQAMDNILTYMSQDHGIEVWNTPIDGKCMPGFEKHCYTGRKAVLAAEALKVRIVPTVFLYVPGGKPAQDLWMRLSTGLTDEQTLSGRVVSFFTAYRRALLEGVHNGVAGAPSVDFSAEPTSGIAPGISVPNGTDEQSPVVRVPTAGQVRKLLTH